MKLVFFFAFALVAFAFAASVPDKEPVPIIRSEFDQQPEGGYKFNYESGDGSVRSEVGEVKEVLDEDNKPSKVVVVRGEFSYKDNEGNPETISYYADETGYHAEGPSVPKAPVARR